MNIWNNETIAGISISGVKKLLQKFTAFTITLDIIQNFFEVTRPKAKIIVKEMIRLGYLQSHPTFKGHWQNATRGNWLIKQPISRLLSEKKINQNKILIEERIQTINNDKSFLYKVENYSIEQLPADIPGFYTYLHMFILLAPKENDKEKLKRLEKEKRLTAEKKFYNILDSHQYPKMGVINFVRKGIHNLLIIHPYLPRINFSRVLTVFDESYPGFVDVYRE